MAFDVFVKIEGVPGECTDDKHQEWIEVLNYSHGVSQIATGAQSTGGGRAAQRADHQDFAVVKALDKTSPKLFLHCCNGVHFRNVWVELCRATGDKTKYMEYHMEDVLVTSVRPAGTAGSAAETLPLEEATFNYGKMTMTYTETDHATGQPRGNVTAYWSTILNKGG